MNSNIPPAPAPIGTAIGLTPAFDDDGALQVVRPGHPGGDFILAPNPRHELCTMELSAIDPQRKASAVKQLRKHFFPELPLSSAINIAESADIAAVMEEKSVLLDSEITWTRAGKRAYELACEGVFVDIYDDLMTRLAPRDSIRDKIRTVAPWSVRLTRAPYPAK